MEQANQLALESVSYLNHKGHKGWARKGKNSCPSRNLWQSFVVRENQ